MRAANGSVEAGFAPIPPLCRTPSPKQTVPRVCRATSQTPPRRGSRAGREHLVRRACPGRGGSHGWPLGGELCAGRAALCDVEKDVLSYESLQPSQTIGRHSYITQGSNIDSPLPTGTSRPPGMAVSNVKALPLFLASATGISLFLFAIRPRLGQHQLDALRKADHADVSSGAPTAGPSTARASMPCPAIETARQGWKGDGAAPQGAPAGAPSPAETAAGLAPTASPRREHPSTVAHRRRLTSATER